MYKLSKNKGFTLVEMLLVAALSAMILLIIYQLNMGAITFFTNVKRDSDHLETKDPAVEVISRYFQRWGTAVVTDSNSTDEINTLPKTEKFIYLPKNNDSSPKEATKTDPIVFYANLSGFGFVQSISGGTANLISCRLNDTLKASGITESCYYVLRNNKILPDLNTNNNSETVSGKTYPLYDSISFNTDIAFTSSGKECVDDGFKDQINSNNYNSTISLAGTVKDRDTVSIGTGINLEPGDIIYRSPKRVEIYVDKNIEDNNKWLFVKLTDIASKCKGTPTVEAIAPADKVTAELVGTSGNMVNVTFDFRSESTNSKGKVKKFRVSKVFGGQ